MNEYKLNHYACAVCWGGLVERWRDGEWVIECAQHPEHTGYVTQSFANQQRKISELEASEAGARLANVLSVKRPDIAVARRLLYGDDEGL